MVVNGCPPNGCLSAMLATSAPLQTFEATVEEVAEWLSLNEGRRVSIDEVRQIEAKALRKLRAEFARRGLGVTDLAPR